MTERSVRIWRRGTVRISTLTTWKEQQTRMKTMLRMMRLKSTVKKRLTLINPKVSWRTTAVNQAAAQALDNLVEVSLQLRDQTSSLLELDMTMTKETRIVWFLQLLNFPYHEEMMDLRKLSVPHRFPAVKIGLCLAPASPVELRT